MMNNKDSAKAEPSAQSIRTNAFRLAALDLDGTLLGPDLTISSENLAAVQTLRSMGTEIVIASGRHYISTLPYAQQVPGVRWLVTSQGGEVSNLAHTQVLHRAFIEPATAQKVLTLSQALGFTTVAYTPEEIFTLSPNSPELKLYTHLEGRVPVYLNPAELAAKNLFKIFWIAPPERLDPLPSRPDVMALPLQKVRSHTHVFEFVPEHVSKGAGLDALTKHLGINPADAAVFGDAENDIPMFEWAGVSAAMPHGWKAALAKATLIAPAGPRETAFARAITAALDWRNLHPATPQHH
jgi:Cof subfamily protein (haloacid dehalogenase superfamily)